MVQETAVDVFLHGLLLATNKEPSPYGSSPSSLLA